MSSTPIYTLSLHDALPISRQPHPESSGADEPDHHYPREELCRLYVGHCGADGIRSEEHTSELQSLTNLVCRLLLEKKKNTLLQSSKTPQSTRSAISAKNSN